MGNAAETGRLHATAALPHSQQQTGRQTLCLREAMIYDVNSVLFRSFLASGGGSHGSGVRCNTPPCQPIYATHASVCSAVYVYDSK